MKITGIEAIPIAMPQARAAAQSGEVFSTREFVIVKVRTDEGIEGIAEASTVSGTWGEPAGAVVSAIQRILSPVLCGEDPFNVRTILAKMDRVLAGFWYSKAAVDVALYDIIGKALGVPVYKLLGGAYQAEVKISRSVANVGISGVDDAVEWARMLHDDFGSTTVKIKVGFDPKADVEIVRRIRKELGDDVVLKVDANQGYGEAKRAIKALRAMDEYNVLIAEQPVLKDDLDGMAAVTRSVGAYVAADESVWGAKDVIRIHEKLAADVLTIYIAKAGGITRNLEVASAAKACGMPCILGGMAELGLGSAANLHFAAAVDALQFPSGIHIPPTLMLTDDIIAEPLAFAGDLVRVPQCPGLGVELDEDRVARYRMTR